MSILDDLNKTNSNSILIVEDSLTQAVKLESILEANNYATLTANNGMKALDILRTRVVDLIISDVNMPEMDGYELCTALKAHPDYKSIPIILLTTQDGILDVLRALSLGADNFISKPYDEKYLLYRVDQMLHHKADVRINPANSKVEFTRDNEMLKIGYDPAKILNFFVSSYEASIVVNHKLQTMHNALGELNKNLENRVLQRTLELQKEVDSHKKTLIALEESLEKSKKLEKLKSEFMQNLSHEIRTPMNSIIGFSELMQMDDIDLEEKLSYLPYISEGADSLLSIVQNILEAAEVMTDNFTVKMSNCFVQDIFDKLELQHKEMLTKEKPGIRLSFDIPNELVNTQLMFDADLVFSVLNKLLSNAIKFSDQGNIHVSVQDSSANEIRFCVKDEGIGIEEKHFDEIFENFKQIENEKHIKFRGTGVGLAIAKRLVDSMKGKIWVNSQLGSGASFYFTVPVTSIKETKRPATKVNTVNAQISLKEITMLVAEDYEANYLLIEMITKRKGVKLIWAKNGAEAVDLFELHQNGIDIVLMDIQMPVMNGLQATRIIKEKHPEAIIVALTAYSTDSFDEAIPDDAFSAWINKPINIHDLMRTINSHVAATA